MYSRLRVRHGTCVPEEMVISHGAGSAEVHFLEFPLRAHSVCICGNISADTLTVNCKRNVQPELAVQKESAC